MRKPFIGLLAYPITPVNGDGELLPDAVAQLVRHAVSAGADGITVLATSGAGVTFDRSERATVVEAAVAAAQEGGAPVYSAISSASTREVVQLAKDAEAAGVNGLVLAPFSYLPLSEDEVRRLFECVSDAVSLPLCFYNKPLQTQYDVSPSLLAHLAGSANVVAVKESINRVGIDDRLRTLRDAVGKGFSIGLSADVGILAQLPRTDAWHTGLAALFPEEYVDVWQSVQDRRLPGSGYATLTDVAAALSRIPRPLGALHALAGLRDVPTGPPRGPFAPATEQDVAALRSVVPSR